MNTGTRQELLTEIQNNFQTIIETYDIDEIGIFEEEGQDNYYFMGYTIKKDDKAYMIHQPYKKDNNQLQLVKSQWTIESEDQDTIDKHGISNLDDALQEIII